MEVPTWGRFATTCTVQALRLFVRNVTGGVHVQQC